MSETSAERVKRALRKLWKMDTPPPYYLIVKGERELRFCIGVPYEWVRESEGSRFTIEEKAFVDDLARQCGGTVILVNKTEEESE
jgi:hypothetical protein